MPKISLSLGGLDVEVEYEDNMMIPEDWLDLISRLDPITAVVVWEVLTNHLSHATQALAHVSPAYEQYQLLKVVAEGDPENLNQVGELAREELDEIYTALIPDDPRRIIH